MNCCHCQKEAKWCVIGSRDWTVNTYACTIHVGNLLSQGENKVFPFKKELHEP